MKLLLDLIKANKAIDEYVVLEQKTTSKELFFIKEKLQMNRGKDVRYMHVTVYKNFEADGEKYKGSSSTKIAPNMTEEEMKSRLDAAILAASNVKNKHYFLPNPVHKEVPQNDSKFITGEMTKNIAKLVQDVYEEDNQFDAFINSTEFFINITDNHLVTSTGVDVTYQTVNGEIELIVEAKGKEESIELFEILHFSDYDQEAIKHSIKEELYYASLRAKAIPMPQVEGVPVLLKGTSAKTLFNFYEFNASGAQFYQQLHSNKIGDNIQGEDVKGDKVTLTLTPTLPNSTRSRYYDGDGVFLKETTLIEEGILKNYFVTKRFADYLKIKPTGNLSNYKVNGGKHTEKELRETPYLELIKFSSFQADSLTGNFGGEFRLGIYHDGEKEIPVTLGSIAANLKTAQKEMFLSKELSQEDNFLVPSIIKFNNVNIAGN